MPYEWLPWLAARLTQAGLTHAEIIEALDSQRRWPRMSTSKDGLRVLQVWARTKAGKPIIIALRAMGGLNWQIIGAKPMTNPQDIADFEEWESQR
ncbi:hypothetical protein [Nocardia sp. CDC160]|uniref:hypothetical protein n=1 Tax=Nocardia sp. CDC160 TaxID=3112166 RepID=UPI002DB7C881|nr:hypothetical protein [Nocardia sp. CDC160]MEC3918235.1 hypothetical protein [Nocardia sp. CDC160]